MSAWMATTKATALLTATQLNPDLQTENTAFVTDLIQRAARWLTSQLKMNRYPHLSKGCSQSGDSASIDLESESTNSFLISVDSDTSFHDVSITLAGLTSGALIATELQAKIRAIGTGAYKFVTVTFDSDNTRYDIDSPSYGDNSRVLISYQDDSEHIVIALKLGATWGGTEYPGTGAMDEADDMVVQVVHHWYHMVGIEGMSEFTVDGSGEYTSLDMPPEVKRFITRRRRMF